MTAPTSQIADQKLSGTFPVEAHDGRKSVISAVAATAQSSLLREISASSLSSELNTALIRQIIANSTQVDKELLMRVEALRNLGNSCLVKRDFTRAIHYWTQVDQIASWIQKEDWIEECRQKICQTRIDQMQRWEQEQGGCPRAFFEMRKLQWQKAPQALTEEQLFLDTIKLDELLYVHLPDCLKSYDLCSWIACCWIAAALKELSTPSSAVQHYLSQINEIHRQTSDLFLIKGKRIYLNPWIDDLYHCSGPFDRPKHEEKQRNVSVVNPLSVQEVIGCIDPDRKTALEQLAKREQLFLRFWTADNADDTHTINASLEALGDAWGEQSLSAREQRHSYWEEALNYALMFYHCAFKRSLRPDIQSKIYRLEEALLLGIEAQSRTPFSWEDHLRHRQTLQQNRDELKRSVDQATKSKPRGHDREDWLRRAKALHKIQQNFVNQQKMFISGLVDECIAILGPPPCGYAMIGFGSLEKLSITPYSDIEFGFLLQEGHDIETNRIYFRRLTHLLHAMVIALGETPIPFNLFDCSFDHLTGMGFCFDLGGKTSLGRRFEEKDKKYGQMKYELIGQPSHFMRYVEDEFFAVDRLLPVEVARCTHIAGDEAITQFYQKLLEKRFSQQDSEARSFYQNRAVALLKGNRFLQGDLDKYNPLFILKSKHGGDLDLKQEIYRISDRLIDSLAFFHRIWKGSAWQKIGNLHKKDVIGLNGERNLRILDGIATELRLKAYHHYHQQKEQVSLLPPLFEDNTTVFHLNVKDCLELFYSISVPLYESLCEFCRKWQQNPQIVPSLKGKIVVDKIDKNEPYVLYRLGDYSRACQTMQRDLELNKELNSNSLFLYNFGLMCLDNKEIAKSLDKFQQVFKKCNLQRGQDDKIIVATLKKLRDIYCELGQKLKCVQLDLYAIAILEKKCRVECPDITKLVFLVQGVPNPSELTQQARAIVENHFEVEHPKETSAIIGNLAHFLYELGEVELSEKLRRKYLEIAEKFYGHDHPAIASFLIGQCNKCHPALGLELAEKCLKTFVKHHGRESQEAAIALNNLGFMHMQLGNYEQAIDNFEKAFKIFMRHVGSNARRLAMPLFNIAKCYFELCNKLKSKEYYLKGYLIEKKYLPENSLSVTPLVRHSLVSMDLNQLKEAKMYAEEAVKIMAHARSQPQAQSGYFNDLNALGQVHCLLGAFEEAKRTIHKIESLRNLPEKGNDPGEHIGTEILWSFYYRLQGDTHQADEKEKGAVQLFNQRFGDNPKALKTLQKDIERARALSEQVALPLSLQRFSVSELIELALQIDCGMYPLLPERWRNPGVAGLCAFRLIADRLHLLPHISEKVSAFIQKVDAISQQAVALLEKEGSKAIVKPLVNQLFEIEGGFQRQPFSWEETQKIQEAIVHLPNEGQLCYRESDGRFFLLVHSGYVDVPLSVTQLSSAPSAAIGQAHITVNEGMEMKECQRWWQKLSQEYGETDHPLYVSSQAKGIRYLKCKAIFKVAGAYTGTPKTNSRLKRSAQLSVECDWLQQLARKGLGPKDREYCYHITFAEEKREPYSRMMRIRSLHSYLQDSELSLRLARLLH